MIEFKLGNFFQNKTARYVLPILNSFPNSFKINYQKVKTGLVCTAIGDVCYDYAKGKSVEHCLFMVYDINGLYSISENKYVDAHKCRQNLMSYIRFLKKEPYYLDDYVIQVGMYHCIVIKLPDTYKPTIQRFITSKYSTMYTNQQLSALLIKEKNDKGQFNAVFGVLTKHPDYIKIFQEKLNEHFNTNIVIEDDRELDLPINLNEEVLNNNKRTLLML